jgi:hemerythrin-like domain-containing protein
MQVTQELINEHQLILKYLDLMERYIEVSQENKDENLLLENAQGFISFIQKFIDTYHHAKEEDILFKYLQAPGVLSHCNPLPVMLGEHEQCKMYVSNMNNALENNDSENLHENATAYSQTLKQHILKENNILYPMAESGLSEDDKISIENEYKQIEEKLNKQEIWDECEEKYSELENCLNSKISATA